MLGGLRLSMRIARREALRYKGRSALSIVLLGLPLLGVSIGASAYDTIMLSPEEQAQQYLGGNDAYVEAVAPGVAIDQYSWDSPYFSYGSDSEDMHAAEDVEADPAALLPEGADAVPFSVAEGAGDALQVETADGLGTIQSLGYDLADPVYQASGIEMLDGEAPTGDEVVLTEAAADHLGLGIGDELTTADGTAYQVSGIAELPWELKGQYAIGPAFPAPAKGWLIDLPGTFTLEDAHALNDLGAAVWATALVDTPSEGIAGAVDRDTLVFYGLMVVIVVMEVVLLSGPAFAISARRRTREFALMSASGAAPAQIRNTVLAGGLIFGIVAAVAAVVLGILGVLAGMPLLEQLFGHRAAGLRVLPPLQAAVVGVAIVTGLMSALTAALSASRVNVVAALAGRTPQRRVRKRWLVIGLALAAAGLVSAFVGVTVWNTALLALAIVAVQLGLVACTPALLAATARLGRWLPLAPRMALREAGRNRGSAAPAIAAVLGVVAGGVAIAATVAAGAVRESQMEAKDLMEGSVELTLYNGSYGEPIDWDPMLADAEESLGRHLDDLELTPITQYGCTPTEEQRAEEVEVDCHSELVRPEENQCPIWEESGLGTDMGLIDLTSAEQREVGDKYRDDPRCDENPREVDAYMDGLPGSADPEVVAAYTGFEGEQLDEAVAVLESGGVLVSDPHAVADDGTASIVQHTNFWSADGESDDLREETVEFPAMAVDEDLLGVQQMFLSPGAAERLGLSQSDSFQAYLVGTSTEVDATVEEAIAAEVYSDGSSENWAQFRVWSYEDNSTFYVVLAAAGLCALIALGATAVSTGLIIAEQRRDMTTLGAVGADPGVRKRFAMWQTVVIAVFGAGLGTGAGLVAYSLVREALNRPLQYRYPFETLYGWELPWPAIGITVLAVPLIAAAGALVFTRAKLPSERRIT